MVPRLREVARRRVGTQLFEVDLHSPALARTTSVRLLVPDDLPRGGDLPVLWLLHGGDDDHTSWSRSGEVAASCADRPLVVVMPDCGPGGWYSDWHERSGPAGPQQWETHHLIELRSWLESELPVRRDRRGRAVAGLSMGGFGAMSYAARHPDMFGFAAAFSGAVDILDPLLGPFADAMAELNGGRAGDIWGPPDTGEARRRARNPVDLAANLSSLTVELRTGNGHPGGRHGPASGDRDLIEQVVHRTSTTLHRRLLDEGVGHLWDDYGPGVHDWPYWADALCDSIESLVEVFEQPCEALPDVPFGPVERLEHVSWDRSVRAWGWAVECGSEPVDRVRLNLSPTDVIGELAGSAIVRTPIRRTPGTSCVVRLDGEETRLIAGVDGTVELAVEGAFELSLGEREVSRGGTWWR